MPSSYFNSAKVCGEGKREEWLHGKQLSLPKKQQHIKNEARDILKTVPPERTTTTTTTTTIFIVLLIQKSRVIKRK